MDPRYDSLQPEIAQTFSAKDISFDSKYSNIHEHILSVCSTNYVLLFEINLSMNAKVSLNALILKLVDGFEIARLLIL